MAEGPAAKKRLREIKGEINALKEKLVALKTERTTLKAKVQAAKGGNADKPAS